VGAAVQPIYLFDLALQRSQWLSVRQSVVAENIANANTPNYRARDVEPFEATLDKTELSMAGTRSGHILPASLAVSASEIESARSWDIASQGNDVSLEKELIKAGEVSRDFSLNTGIVKSFHRMWMASVKG
jgi:flagellar basal-body rod protein FlgB